MAWNAPSPWQKSVDVLTVIVGAFTALGTVAVAILAIWGDTVRDRLIGPRLSLQLKETVGHAYGQGEKRRIYYHFEVANKPRRRPAENCRVILCAIERQDAAGGYVN